MGARTYRIWRLVSDPMVDGIVPLSRLLFKVLSSKRENTQVRLSNMLFEWVTDCKSKMRAQGPAQLVAAVE